MMPALSGTELANVLRRNDIPSIVILYSSKDPAELQKLVAETGAAGAISKSESAEGFMKRFEALLRVARAAESTAPARKEERRRAEDLGTPRRQGGAGRGGGD